MLRTLLAAAMRAPDRHLSFRRAVAVHVLLLTGLGWAAATAHTPAALAAVGQAVLVLGIVEGAALVGWRLAQLPKSQALEFLLVTPVRPRQLFLSEAAAGVGRFALVSVSGLPVLLAMVLCGAVGPADLWPLGVMPFAWGVVTALGLTAWAYEGPRVRRVGEWVGTAAVLLYLVVGILAGENLRAWLRQLPPAAADWTAATVAGLINDNPFGVVRNWFVRRDGPAAVWPKFVEVNVIAVLLVWLFGLRASGRLKAHFHDRHYKPIASGRADQSRHIGEWPLSWWAVRRVMEYSGRVNVYLAGGFCLLYAAFLVAGDRWPPWLGRSAFLVFEQLGGAPAVAAAMCVLAAVPAAFQYGLWDPTIPDRCRRLELLLLTDLTGRDYWHASLAAAWRRGRAYLGIAAVLWVALAWSGRAAWHEAAAAAAGGLLLWGFSFAVGFRMFSTGGQAGGVATGLTLGLPLLLFALLRAGLDGLAALVPTAACYLPVRTGVTWAWADGFVVALAAAGWLTRRGVARCDAELRRWYDANQGRKAA
ncbi:MAG: hypothetical protein C0501_27250 [Isosphaera sp.]|nr:hypothetical protein [Isosphaera sp.]